MPDMVIPVVDFEMLHAEIRRLRAALEQINDLHVDEADRCFDIAWTALGEPKRGA